MDALVGYRVSRDYDKLWDLAKKQNISCVVDDHIIQTILEQGEVRAPIGKEGYFWAANKEMFVAQCEYYDVEYLMPPEGKDVDDQKNGLQLKIGNEVYWVDSGMVGVVCPWRDELRIESYGKNITHSFCDTDNIKLLPCSIPTEEQFKAASVKLIGFWIPRFGEKYISERSWSSFGQIIIFTRTGKLWDPLRRQPYDGKRLIVVDSEPNTEVNKPKDDVRHVSLGELQEWLDNCPSEESHDLLMLTGAMLDGMAFEDVRRLTTTCRSKEIEMIDTFIMRADRLCVREK